MPIFGQVTLKMPATRTIIFAFVYMKVLVIEIETHAPRSATRCRDHFHLVLEYSSTHAVIRVDFKHVYNYNQAHDRPQNTFRFSYLV